ncbi:TPA: hypothetical protein NBJ18_001542 [Citrobacter farmeri]|uniref:hypothetical protein n=1 Tax=Citrobacter farmeri TaxID=67824 RepID=UPI00292E091D|nr:hypothetical protein [Citrobacter farmeri]HCD1999559.1 hypothetical protein [Citrobacter farmeri]
MSTPPLKTSAQAEGNGGPDLANCAELFLLLPMKKREGVYTFHPLTYLSMLFFK